MSECLKCKHCGRLEPLPRGDPSRLQSGQWGMLARGLVYCSLPGEIGGYKRFRSVESKDRCKYFRKESDQSRIERRCLTVITTNLSQTDFEEEGLERITSRVNQLLYPVTCTWDDYRERTAVSKKTFEEVF